MSQQSAQETKLAAAKQELQAAEASKNESLIASARAILSSTTDGVVTAQGAVKTAQDAVTYWSNLLYSSPGWSPRLVGVELNPGPCQGAISEGKCDQGCTLTPEQVKGFKPDGICDCGHSYLRHGVLTAQSTASPSHLSPSLSAAKFNSFLSALDMSTALPIPFAPSLTYRPLVQQTGHTQQPAILGNKEDGARLFIRACYPEIWQLISQQRDAYLAGTSLRKATLVTGNAGVGKSIFLAYIIKQLRSLPPAASPTIIYQHLSANQCFVIPPGVAKATEYEQVSPSMVDNSSVVYLVDIGGTANAGPLTCAAFTIVVASPHATHKDIVTDWQKHSQFPPTFYMPCWSEQELQICRQVVRPTDMEYARDAVQGARLLPAVSEASVAERFQQFGGTARVAFTQDSYLPALNQQLSKAINACNLEVIAGQLGTDLDLLPDSSSWLLHYIVDEKNNFSISDIKFASQPILEKVWQQSASGQHNAVLRFVDSTSKNPTWTTARGNLFEPLAAELLRQGGAFYVHQFTNPLTPTRGMKGHRMTPAASLLQIPPSQLPAQPLPNAAAIAALAAGQYGEPNKTNFPTIDGVLKPNMLFQMTVSTTHDVNIDGLIAATTALQLTPSDPSPRLYFVVPPQQFPTFQVGSFNSSSSTPVTSIPHNLEYWVLQLYPLTTASGKRKMPSSSLTPPPSPKAAATHITLPLASHTHVCSCKGPCKSQACTCRKHKVECNANCHSGLAAELADPLQRHKNCQNHT